MALHGVAENRGGRGAVVFSCTELVKEYTIDVQKIDVWIVSKISISIYCLIMQFTDPVYKTKAGILRSLRH